MLRGDTLHIDKDPDPHKNRICCGFLLNYFFSMATPASSMAVICSSL